MSYPTTGNAAPHFADLSAIAEEHRKLQERAREILDQIRPVLIGQRVRQWGRVWQICQVDVRANARVTCYGVTVSKTGKVGTRGFDLGLLENCEFLEPGTQI